MNFEIGLTNKMETLVTEELTAKHLGSSGGSAVLSTPNMIHLMEQTALNACKPYLTETESTVGVHVDVYHRKSAAVGQTVVTTAELTAIDRRKLTYSVKTTLNDEIVGEGIHDRFVIDKTKFGK